MLLESDANDTENLNKIFRLAHNLKGSSKAVGFERMGAFTHEFETFILKIKNQELTATPDIIGLLLRCNDFLRHMVTTLKQDLDANFEIESWISELTAASSATLVADQSMSDLMVEIAQQAEQISEPSLPAPSDVILDEPVVIEASVPEAQDSLVPEVQNLFVPEAQDLTAELHSSLDGSGTVAPSPRPEVVKQSQKSAPKSSEETLRVAVSKVEDLLNTVGEMVILQSVLSAQIQKLNSQHLQKTSYQLEKVGKEIQDLAMSLRMVPVKPSFQKMQR
ncbi:MAG: Hpt domain-containing protein, partial [Pseudobdellovibrionaceae bacterium]